MPGTIVVHVNSVTRILTVADVRGFLRSCDTERIPNDAVVRVRHPGDLWPARRITEISVRAGERLGDEPNEPAAIRRALDLPPDASSQEVLRMLAGQQERIEVAESREPTVPAGESSELAGAAGRLGRTLGIERRAIEPTLAYLHRLVEHVIEHAPGVAETREYLQGIAKQPRPPREEGDGYGF